MTKPQKTRIFAYGFDAIGFTIPTGPMQEPNCEVNFYKLRARVRLDTADGVIIPQGIFESIQIKYDEFTRSNYTDISVDRSLLLEREREIVNLLKQAKWVCFLVDEIVDSVPQQHSSQSIDDTDLCKKILNRFGVERNRVDAITDLKASSEFLDYIRDYGVAKTIFELPRSELSNSVIVRFSDDACGIELFNSLFFLPFHTTKNDIVAASLIASVVSNAILDYRQKHTAEIADWVDEFKFNREVSLQDQIHSLREQISVLEGQFQSWRSYKLIITSSGDILRNKIINILEDFFQLLVDPLDERREDAKIIDEDNNVLVMIEVKGTKKGIKREHINQVDSHRERNSLPSTLPGVLIINNEMSVHGIDKRLETRVPNEQIKHARLLNILILRTIDLLFLMRHLEKSPDKKGKLMNLISSGGGWLKADSEGYEIIEQIN